MLNHLPPRLSLAIKSYSVTAKKILDQLWVICLKIIYSPDLPKYYALFAITFAFFSMAIIWMALPSGTTTNSLYPYSPTSVGARSVIPLMQYIPPEKEGTEDITDPDCWIIYMVDTRETKGKMYRMHGEYFVEPLLQGRYLPSSNDPQWLRAQELEYPYHLGIPSFYPPRGKKLDLSLVYTVHNTHLMLYWSIHSAVETLKDSGITYEVVIVDDGSDIVKHQKFANKISNVKMAYTPGASLGYTLANNKAIEMAEGEYILILNTDTYMLPGAIKTMLNSLKKHPEWGLVGAKLVSPDQSIIREAGGVLFKDGSGINYGRGKPANHALVNFVYEADWCSAAVVMLPASLLQDKLHGFDPMYAPAYYEDTDLAFRVRKAGYKGCMYLPHATVIHAEGRSYGSGQSSNSSSSRLQARNRKNFLSVWENELTTPRYLPELGELDLFHPLKRPTADKNGKAVLLFDDNPFRPMNDGGSHRELQIIKALHSLGYTTIHYTAATPSHNVPILGEWGVPTLYEQEGVFKVVPKLGLNFTHIIICHWYNFERYGEKIKKVYPNAKLVLDTVDVHFLRLERAAAYDPTGTVPDLAEQKARELKAIADADITWVVAGSEKQILRDYIGNVNIDVVADTTQILLSGIKHQDRPRWMLFVGSTGHPPNIDGIKWFIRDILPTILKSVPDAKVNVVGKGWDRHINATQGVELTGSLSDDELTELLGKTMISIAPMRYGAGIKTKVLIAIGHAVPCVGVRESLADMHLTHETSAALVENAEQFAEHCIRLLTNTKYWDTLSQGGLKVAKYFFSHESLVEAIGASL